MPVAEGIHHFRRNLLQTSVPRHNDTCILARLRSMSKPHQATNKENHVDRVHRCTTARHASNNAQRNIIRRFVLSVSPKTPHCGSFSGHRC